MARVLYVDADNHYYEAEDHVIRYGDQDVKRFVRWVTEGKRRYLVFGSTMNQPRQHERAPPEPHVQPDRHARPRSTRG